MRRFPEDPDAVAQACRAGRGGQIIIVSGWRGAGKTSWCLALASRARALGLTVAGLASPAVFCDGRKVAIDLRDLAGGETRRLAERARPEAPGTATLGWRFDPAVLAWGNGVLAAAKASDLFVIDELGPLEFVSRAGLTNAFAAIDTGRHHLTVAVIRPELTDEALRRWPRARVLAPAGHAVAPNRTGDAV